MFREAAGPPRQPRNTVIGHFLGVVGGMAGIAVFGLFYTPDVLATGVTAQRVGAAAVAMAVTAGAELVRAVHPPAGATTLIVCLGLLDAPRELVAIMGGSCS